MFIKLNMKQETAILFLPTDNGSYDVFSTRLKFVQDSILLDSLRTIVLVDPPEHIYSFSHNVRKLVFCSNNDKRHYNNADKDTNKIYYIGMPTDGQMSYMINKLLPEVKIMDSGLSNLSTDTEIKKELQRRSFLVGNAARYLFDTELFNTRCTEIRNEVDSKFQKLKLSDLMSLFMHRTRVGNADDSYFSSKLFNLNTDASTQEESYPLLNFLASSYLAGKLAASGGNIFQDYNTIEQLGKVVSVLLEAGGEMFCSERNEDG